MPRKNKDILDTMCPSCLGGKYILTTRTHSFIKNPKSDNQAMNGVPLAHILQHHIEVKCPRCRGKGNVIRKRT